MLPFLHPPRFLGVIVKTGDGISQWNPAKPPWKSSGSIELHQIPLAFTKFPLIPWNHSLVMLKSTFVLVKSHWVTNLCSIHYPKFSWLNHSKFPRCWLHPFKCMFVDYIILLNHIFLVVKSYWITICCWLNDVKCTFLLVRPPLIRALFFHRLHRTCRVAGSTIT